MPPLMPSKVRKFKSEYWILQALPQCRSINNLNPLGISGTLRHFQDRTVVNSRPAAFSRRYRVVSGLLGVLTTSSSCCFSGWKDMSERPYHLWIATTSTDLESQFRPSQDPSCQVWERRQFKSGRDKLSCFRLTSLPTNILFKITKSMDLSLGYFPTDSLKKKKMLPSGGGSSLSDSDVSVAWWVGQGMEMICIFPSHMFDDRSF